MTLYNSRVFYKFIIINRIIFYFLRRLIIIYFYFLILNIIYYFIEKDWILLYNTPTNTELLGIYLYTYGFYPLILIGLILLVAIIGSIVLTLNQNVNVKRQIIYKQLEHNIKKSIQLKN